MCETTVTHKPLSTTIHDTVICCEMPSLHTPPRPSAEFTNSVHIRAGLPPPSSSTDATSEFSPGSAGAPSSAPHRVAATVNIGSDAAALPLRHGRQPCLQAWGWGHYAVCSLTTGTLFSCTSGFSRSAPLAPLIHDPSRCTALSCHSLAAIYAVLCALW